MLQDIIIFIIFYIFTTYMAKLMQIYCLYVRDIKTQSKGLKKLKFQEYNPTWQKYCRRNSSFIILK